MSKSHFKGFLKASTELILVIFQFTIIILHFIQWEFLTKREITQVNYVYSFLGFSIIIIASFFMLMAIKELGRNLTPFPKPKAKGILIKTGIYSFMRHPMYYSLILISFGFFIIKLSFYYLSLTISLIVIIKFKIILEEQYLKQKFEKYILYKKKVQY